MLRNGSSLKYFYLSCPVMAVGMLVTGHGKENNAGGLVEN